MPKTYMRQGDCLTLMQSLPDASVDLILCDLPYGTTACKWDSVIPFEALWEQYHRIAKPGAPIVLTASQPLKIHEDIAVFSRGTAKYFPQKTLRDTPIKLGKNVSKSGSSNLAHAKIEYTGKVYTDKNPESILFFDTRAEGQVKLHPTQKPVALMEYLIRTYTNEGATVLDNCMGSGTTGVACMNTGRNFIGFELDTEFFNVASARVLDAKTKLGLPNA